MVSLARLLLQPRPEWEKTKSQGKVPKPTMDVAVAAIAMDVLQRRLEEYPTSIEVSESTQSLSVLGLTADTGGREPPRRRVPA